VNAFHWSIKEIDETDMESLIAFVLHFPRWKQDGGKREQKTYCDQADWL
jgi:hypothetical protein